jgi:hypothetical protein
VDIEQKDCPYKSNGRERQMKIKEGFLLRKIADIHVVVPVGESSLDFNGVITLNDTATFLFGQLQIETTKEALLEHLLAEYEVDKDTAEKDIDTFFVKLREANLLV